MNRQLAIVAVAALMAACGGKKDKSLPIQTAAVTRQTIVIDAEANGTVEPINIVEVKSKASGLITKMPVETGDLKKPGDLLVQIDTRDVQNQFNQADAALQAAKVKLDVSTSAKKRSDEMFKARVITQEEHEAAALDYENAKSGVVSAAASLDLAKQRLEDATVTAPVAGTVIEKDVSQGVVITSATGAFGGGTTLLKMADLTTVRVRAFFNETDIGQVRPAQQATVVVDAYPDRRFQGLVEKIEPQAVVQQGVTMFPVLVTLDNREGYLKPGMNGEVSVLVDQLNDVLAVPIDAVKSVREAVTTAPMLGLNPDSVQAEIRAQFAANSAGGFGGSGAMGGGNGQRGNGGAPSGGRTTGTARGEVALDPQQGGGFQMPDVSDKDCAAVKTAMAKKPDAQKKIDDLRDQMRNGSVDRMTAFQQMQQIYASVGVDARIAGACRMKERTAQGGGSPNGAPTNVAQSGKPKQGKPGSAQVSGSLRPTTGEMPPVAHRARPGLVFVAVGEKEKRTFHPRVIMIGQSNFDYSEVVSGLKEGEQVVLLGALSMQAQRQQMSDRFRGMSGIPGMNQNQGGGARPGGAAGGGAPRGGGR